MEYRIDKYTMLQLGQYKENYQLIEGWESQDGSFKPNFCKREFGKKGEKQEKVLPVSVKLGDKEAATFALTSILKEIAGKDFAPMLRTLLKTETPEEDVPF